MQAIDQGLGDDSRTLLQSTKDWIAGKAQSLQEFAYGKGIAG